MIPPGPFIRPHFLIFRIVFAVLVLMTLATSNNGLAKASGTQSKINIPHQTADLPVLQNERSNRQGKVLKVVAMYQEFLSDTVILPQKITSLTLKIHTDDAKDAGTDDKVYFNLKFQDGSLLFSPENFELNLPDHEDRERGQTDSYSLPIPKGLNQEVRNIAEFYIRKSADGDGWLLGSALLFANGVNIPIIGNSQINQFLKNKPFVLNTVDWSTRSLAVPVASPAQLPLAGASYRIAGPVLGQITDTSANVLYRVEREGEYRLKVLKAGSGEVIFDESQTLSPTATFRVKELESDTHYKFNPFHVHHHQNIPAPEGDGEFRTYPPEGKGVKFTFAFGSCSNNSEDVTQNVWMGIRNLAPDPSSDPFRDSTNGVRLFIHLGDTFYYYDHATDKGPENMRSILAANLSERKQPRFLEMARVIPSVAVWDDHDFRRNDMQSTNYPMKHSSVKGFLDYWGNNAEDPTEFGLFTLVTYGNVDIYLMDGRFFRDKSSGILFSRSQLDRVLEKIKERGAQKGRLVILASGSLWNNTVNDDSGEEAYGHDTYDAEREAFYKKLSAMLGRQIQGLAFLSGDVHRNEIYEIDLLPSDQPFLFNRVAPEFVSSPLGKNSVGDTRDIVGERKWNFASKNSGGKSGFATLTIDTRSPIPEGNWSMEVKYYSDTGATLIPYHSKKYILHDSQFRF